MVQVLLTYYVSLPQSLYESHYLSIYFYAIFMHFNLRNAVLLFSICRNIDYIFK